MTGEITLRGAVLPVGGIKEKVLAAYRAGITTIILPAWNRKDMEDIPSNVQKSIKFHFVEDMLDVLKLALEAKGKKKGLFAKREIIVTVNRKIPTCILIVKQK